MHYFVRMRRDTDLYNHGRHPSIDISGSAILFKKNTKGQFAPTLRAQFARPGQTGVDDGTRTHDDRDHNPGLYQLSYAHH